MEKERGRDSFTLPEGRMRNPTMKPSSAAIIPLLTRVASSEAAVVCESMAVLLLLRYRSTVSVSGCLCRVAENCRQ